MVAPTGKVPGRKQRVTLDAVNERVIAKSQTDSAAELPSCLKSGKGCWQQLDPLTRSDGRRVEIYTYVSLPSPLAPITVINEHAASISRTSAGVSWTSTAAKFSSSRSSFLVPGIGTIHGL